jgi:hypothetical protein
MKIQCEVKHVSQLQLTTDAKCDCRIQLFDRPTIIWQLVRYICQRLK